MLLISKQHNETDQSIWKTLTLQKKKKKKENKHRKKEKRDVSELGKGTHPKNEKQDPCTAFRHLPHSTHN